MTMPDLETYHIKRAPGVHYVYIHHSMVSSHMIYRKEAFDHFDSVFCCGPHHIEEIRKREEQAGLKPKLLIEHGYGKLDSILSDLDNVLAGNSAMTGSYTILIAPSWGEDALFERQGSNFIGPLLDAGYRVIARPHPQTQRFHPEIIRNMIGRYEHYENFLFDDDMSSKRSFLEADLMVSDWSGAALEFAFARLRPVLFIDVPRKVMNPDYPLLGIEPFEVQIREKIGRVISEEEIMSLPTVISGLRKGEGVSKENIRIIRDSSIYNVGESGKVGAEVIMDFLHP
jgi:Putative glycosyl/glycerophosphate transferases involved in teichoic acid biosynthesis TagF/TagB/EpsJ/RodC